MSTPHRDLQRVDVPVDGMSCVSCDPEAEELHTLRPRLYVAIALSIPVLLISMVPPLQFGGWQWVAFVLAIIVTRRIAARQEECLRAQQATAPAT